MKQVLRIKRISTSTLADKKVKALEVDLEPVHGHCQSQEEQNILSTLFSISKRLSCLRASEYSFGHTKDLVNTSCVVSRPDSGHLFLSIYASGVQLPFIAAGKCNGYEYDEGAKFKMEGEWRKVTAIDFRETVDIKTKITKFRLAVSYDITTKGTYFDNSILWPFDYTYNYLLELLRTDRIKHVDLNGYMCSGYQVMFDKNICDVSIYPEIYYGGFTIEPIMSLEDVVDSFGPPTSEWMLNLDDIDMSSELCNIIPLAEEDFLTDEML